MKKFISIIFIIFISYSSFAQKWKLTRYEASAGVGFANYFGDIGGSATESNWFGLKDISILGTRPTLALGARYKLTEDMSIKLNLNVVMLGGSDKGSINEIRGYSFNSYGFEHSLQYEYYLMSEDKKTSSFARFNRRGMLNNYSKTSLYVFGALGGNYISSSLKANISSVEQTQPKTYAPIGAIGIGVKLIYNNLYAFSFEFGPRYALSDYLDGFTTQFSKYNDVYYFGSFSLVYRIKTSRKGYPLLFRSY